MNDFIEKHHLTYYFEVYPPKYKIPTNSIDVTELQLDQEVYYFDGYGSNCGYKGIIERFEYSDFGDTVYISGVQLLMKDWKFYKTTLDKL